MMPMRLRSSNRPILPMLTPSISIEPPQGSTIRISASTSVDFPAPVRPATPTFSPAAICKLMPFSTVSRPGR
jgi:hypothetical protein